MDDDFVPTPSITRFGNTPAYNLTQAPHRKARFEDGAELRQLNITNFVAPVFDEDIIGDEESDDNRTLGPSNTNSQN
ncbi:hypothetical protein K3495_g14230 [Podosphaera aphanis]|nr:hypothetical protein K3495_g14230 [Podosphaera aphanis]